MKQGWEIKKLGDVCTIERGGSPRPIDAYITDEDNGINWIKIGDATPNSKYITSTKEKIKPEGIRKSRMVYKGDFILSNSMSFGRPYILGVDGCIHDGWLVLRDNENTFDKIFLYYYLSSPFIYQEFKRLAVGGVVNNLNSELVRGVNVIVPPIAEQEKIVAELDCLSGIIEKKKQQLKELDNLAQSIFYEMFGDPVENDKGWEMKRLGDVSDVTSFKRVLIEDVVEEGVPFIRGTELSALSKLPNSKNYEFTLFITPEHYNKVKAISGVPVIGDLLIPSINADGLIWVVDTNEPRYYKDGRVLWVHTNREYSNSTALRYIMSNKLRLLYKELASGATFIELKLFVLRDMVLPFPPLTLQQDFASKIESIEKQKELIAQSIKETETLFNSRMDYYFN